MFSIVSDLRGISRFSEPSCAGANPQQSGLSLYRIRYFNAVVRIIASIIFYYALRPSRTVKNFSLTRY